MGQRHQLYFKLHAERELKVDGQEIKTHMISFHDQWAYGTLPLQMLYNVLLFNKNIDDSRNFSNKESYTNKGFSNPNPAEILTHLLSVNPSTGLLTSVIDTTDETVLSSGRHDPRRGDNNDGITVCDFTVTGKPAYAFVSFEEDSSTFKKFLDPMTAEEYLTCYYKKGSKKWKDWRMERWPKRIDKLARPLTVEELAKLFPDMYEGWLEERELLKDPKKAPILLATARFQSNKDAAQRLLVA